MELEIDYLYNIDYVHVEYIHIDTPYIICRLYMYYLYVKACRNSRIFSIYYVNKYNF